MLLDALVEAHGIAPEWEAAGDGNKCPNLNKLAARHDYSGTRGGAALRR